MSTHRVLVLLGAAALAAFVAPTAHSQTQPEIAVYASDSGDYEGIKLIGTTASENYDLYIDKLGTAAGEEIYGYDVLIRLEGPGHIAGFLEDSAHASAIEYFPETFTSNSKQLRITFVDVDPADAGWLPIGTLTVDATGAVGAPTLRAVGNGAVTAALNLENIPNQVIALPEPSETALLVAGIAGLAVLYRLRRADATGR
jgi:hypothetical protein